jgi:hypothetical protein
LRRLPLLAAGLLAAGLAGALALPADAAPGKKFHFELAEVTTKPEVKPEIAKLASQMVEAEVRKQFASNPALIATLDGAPDPKSNAEGYRKYLAQKGVTGAYLVSVDIPEASEELEPMDGKPNSQRLIIHLAIHMLGENVPGRTMGFTGDGKATIKQEVGLKLRDSDRQATWSDVTQSAVDDAMKKAFQQLGQPIKK